MAWMRAFLRRIVSRSRVDTRAWYCWRIEMLREGGCGSFLVSRGERKEEARFLRFDGDVGGVTKGDVEGDVGDSGSFEDFVS